MMCLILTASCDRTPSTSTPPKGTAPAKSEAVAKLKVGFVYVSPVGDGGWTWAHDQGRKELEKLSFIETTRYLESVPEGAEATRAITQFANQGFNVIFTTSFGYMDPTVEVAARYPKQVFMHCSGYKTAANLGTYFGRIYQARYLSGIVAGKKTKTNILGYVAAYPIPEVIRGINAFTLGVRSVSPKAEVRVVWSHTWYDPSKERACAESLLDLNADVIAQHQDSPAAQQAAQDRDKYSVGYDSDMTRFAPKAHLTAPVWNWAIIYKYVAENVYKNTWKSEKIWWGIKEGVTDICPINDKLVSADIIRFVQGRRQDIIDGKEKVFVGPIQDQGGKVRIPAGVMATDDEMLSMDYFVKGVIGSTAKGN